MRISALLSALFHVALIATLFSTWSFRSDFTFTEPVNIPVEFLEIGEETNIRAAVEERDEPEPEPVEEEVIEEVPEPPPQEVASLPDPVLELADEAPEVNPFVEPEPEPVVPEPEPEEQASVPDLGSARPSFRPDPPPRRDDFNFGSAEEVLRDLTPQEEEEDFFANLNIGDQTNVDVADERRDRVGRGTGLTISQMDLVRGQIYECWNLPTGVPTPEDKVVIIRAAFNPDGTLRGQPRVVDQIRYNTDRYFRTVAESAIRALISCQNGRRFDGSTRTGYDFPRDRYDEWREHEFEFDLAGAMGLR